MALSPGERLGPYEIVSKIGAGGMGEVYRARDPRLGREVAIKISQEQFSERFEREARAIASLNHPNICTLYDVGLNYLVMELVEGESPKGPFPLETAMNYARQIAGALEEAHSTGIVHRDLKPANIKIKSDGTIKVLDFGLAKYSGPARGSGGGDDSPTISTPATQAGIILGTAAYMAPEQAKGKTVDKRADIWAFGVVLYEMLTGERLFRGDDISDVLAAVIRDKPDLGKVPSRVKPLLEKCLEKDPRNRLRDIGDMDLLLQGPHPAAPSKRSRLGIGIATIATAAAITLSALVAYWAPSRTEKPSERPLVRLDTDLGPDVAFAASSLMNSLNISADGSRIAYISGSPPRLYTRRLDQPKGIELAGTEGAQDAFFSPDGRWIGFVKALRGPTLSKVSVDGGAVVSIADIPTFAGAAWDVDGSIIVGIAVQGLVRISPNGGEPTMLAPLASGELILGNPQILPGGKAILAGAAGPDFAGSIDVVTLADHKRKTLLRGSHGRYVPTGNGFGHLLYNSRSTLFAIPFDLEKLETRGAPTPIVDDMRLNTSIGFADYAVAPSGSGTLVYRRRTGAPGETGTIDWLHTSGKRERLRREPGSYDQIRLSPDGNRLGFTTGQGPEHEVWVYDIRRDTATRLLSGGTSGDPVWSPNGRYLIVSKLGKGLSIVRADGSAQPEVFIDSQAISVPGSFTRDGTRFAYTEFRGHPQIFTASVDEKNGRLVAGKPEQFLSSQFNDTTPVFSPDGRWIAYVSSESGGQEVYVRPFPASVSGGKWPISNGGGTNPAWSPNGHELFYQSADNIMDVTYTVKADAFVPDKPRVWISKFSGSAWDLDLDGRRIAVVTPAQTREVPQQEHEVVFLFNLFDELRRRAPLPR